jgi:hypothetical protein
MPVLIVFKYGSHLTLAVINRRLHKKDNQKDVLEKVTLIKDIRIDRPHRAHIDILFDLSFPELQRKCQCRNFVELHDAWRKTLDTKELNKAFYLQLSNWYYWAMQHVSFPADAEKDENKRNAVSLIRLITRVIFVWFIKEMNLVPEKLFDKTALQTMVRDFLKNKSAHSYYRAILQNLFFATLNQRMGERAFALDGTLADNQKEYGVKNLYRYAALFGISDQEALALFSEVPFLNGGLFDCLDKPDDNGKIVYVDGFSRNPKKQAYVPDFLFFAEETDIDLNETFGTTNKCYKVSGLIDILSGFKFTVSENTPIEEEVALDPELLGKVFENLLASYNPETQTTARKQTGSFYTPREIVDYMVEESLIQYLKSSLLKESPGFMELGSKQIDIFGNASRATQLVIEKKADISPWKDHEQELEDELRHLLAYTDEPHRFDRANVQMLIQAIDAVKILDPACGSGAFPMGVLHKLVQVLHKLDPNNVQWKERQLYKAAQIDDPMVRDNSIQDIESAFANNELDYGRKLYLIENCIYGVDIQPIAVQIAKLRFFISLIVDQKRQAEKENLGIRALPNLETKFICADTLIEIEKPVSDVKGKKGMGFLRSPEIEKLEDEIKKLRHTYFSAKTRKEKLEHQRKDKLLRKRIADLLIQDEGWNNAISEQLSNFDPYDQNVSSPFFDSEWMFGVRDGFNVVIGNPPYLRIQGVQATNPKLVLYAKEHYKTAVKGNWDLYVLFMEKGFELLKPEGILAYIQPHKFFQAEFGGAIRNMIAKEKSLHRIVHFGAEQMFDSATNYTCLFFMQKKSLKDFFYIYVKNPDQWLEDTNSAPVIVLSQPEKDQKWAFTTIEKLQLFEKLKRQPILLGDIVRKIFQGIATSADKIYVLEIIKWKKDTVLAFSSSLDKEIEIEKGLVKPFLMGKDVKRYEKPMAKNIVIFPYLLQEGKYSLMNQDYIKRHFPLGWQYIHFNRKALESRENGRMKHEKYYAYIYPKNLNEFDAPKIMTPDIANKSNFSIDIKSNYHTTTIYSFAFKDNITENLEYFLGLFNSRLFWFFMQLTGNVLRGGYLRFKTEYLKPFPVRVINFADKKDMKLYNAIVQNASGIVNAKQNSEDTLKLEAKIDALIFHLYDFNEQEMLDVLLQLPDVSEAERREIQAQYKSIRF